MTGNETVTNALPEQNAEVLPPEGKKKEKKLDRKSTRLNSSHMA